MNEVFKVGSILEGSLIETFNQASTATAGLIGQTMREKYKGGVHLQVRPDA